MTKTKLYAIVFVLFSVLFTNCNNEDELKLENDTIINTYTKNLPKDVKKIETVKLNNLWLRKSNLISKQIEGNSTNDLLATIYYYKNNNFASLIEKNRKVYVTIFNKKGDEIENMIVDFNKDIKDKVVSINYLNKDKILMINIESSTIKTKNWGGCMEGAIGRLYNDWRNDAGGTFSCWVTGPLCAIGGGIACML